jgi:hypothetical protein
MSGKFPVNSGVVDRKFKAQGEHIADGTLSHTYVLCKLAGLSTAEHGAAITRRTNTPRTMLYLRNSPKIVPGTTSPKKCPSGFW